MKPILTILVSLVNSQAYNGPFAGDWTVPSRYPEYLKYIDSSETCIISKITACRYN